MKRLESAATAIMVVAAVMVAGALVHRQLGGSGPASVTGAPVSADSSVREVWPNLIAASRKLFGRDGAPVLIVLSDYECPGCRALHATLAELDSETGGALDVRLAHFPLDYHRFALPAARAAECAAKQGRFREFSEVVFRHQDSLGLLSWASLAERARVDDPTRIEECARGSADSSGFPAIASGVALAAKVAARGTPTLVLDGVRLGRTPSKAELLRLATRD